jgi:hypothetical protein
MYGITFKKKSQCSNKYVMFINKKSRKKIDKISTKNLKKKKYKLKIKNKNTFTAY